MLSFLLLRIKDPAAPSFAGRGSLAFAWGAQLFNAEYFCEVTAASGGEKASSPFQNRKEELEKL
jgi:hypothetical protein